MTDREQLYRGYLHHCNEHRFDRLGEFVAEDVEVNDAVQGLQAYVYRFDGDRIVAVWVAADNHRLLEQLR